MENITSGRAADLCDEIIVPVTVYTDMRGSIRVKVQSGARRALILVLVFAAGLRTGAFTWLDIAKPCTCAHHEFILSSFTVWFIRVRG